MKKYFHALGACTLAFIISGLPVIALAENDRENNGKADTQVEVRILGVQASTSSNGRVESNDRATSTERIDDEDEDEKVSDEDQDEQEIEFELEDDEDIASSLDDLKQKIEMRKQELEDEEASTTSKDREIVKNANPVRIAVHALLSSKELLGGIGGQVSEIAKQMNTSVATTTNAESKIQSRGFWNRFFFGGDSVAANVILQEIAKNQQRIDDLTKLLAEANVSVDIQATLNAQITALQDAQARLQDLAEKEQKMWGLFSWRF